MKGNRGRKMAGLILVILLLVGTGLSSGKEAAMSKRLSEIESLFNNFNRDSMQLADDFYDPKVVFRDPLVALRGRDSLKAYYLDMYQNVTSIRFDFSGGIERDAYLYQLPE